MAGASCNARVVLPNGQDEAGLHNPQIADAGGNVAWRYPAPPTTPGQASDIVSCTLNGLSGSAQDFYLLGS